MNACELVGADDNIGQSGAVFQDEHSAVASSGAVSVACAAAVVLSVAHVLDAGDGAGC